MDDATEKKEFNEPKQEDKGIGSYWEKLLGIKYKPVTPNWVKEKERRIRKLGK